MEWKKVFDYTKLKYMGKKYYRGRPLGMMVSYGKEYGDGYIYCHKCHNFANGVKPYFVLNIFRIRVPICRPHYEEDNQADDKQLIKLNPYFK